MQHAVSLHMPQPASRRYPHGWRLALCQLRTPAIATPSRSQRGFAHGALRLPMVGVDNSGDGDGEIGDAGGADASARVQMAARTIARDIATHNAFPTARCALRLPCGSLHSDPNPMSTADSRAVITRWVCPSRLHHVSACEAQTVKLCSSTDRTHAVPSRLRVWFLKCVLGNSSPNASNASRTETRRADGISRSSCISLGGAAIRRIRV